jgi:hypothetical protein
MTLNHDHATLFVAPSTPPAVEAADRSESTVDDGAEAMRRLRHPFAVRPAEATASAEAFPSV